MASYNHIFNFVDRMFTQIDLEQARGKKTFSIFCSIRVQSLMSGKIGFDTAFNSHVTLNYTFRKKQSQTKSTKEITMAIRFR